MKKIKIFLASSNELKKEREKFEIEIYRKCKLWFNKGLFLHLDIWEDLTARVGENGSQEEYNKKVREADLFLLLVGSKLGMYAVEEFETAFTEFHSNEKPFIFTYFKENNSGVDKSLELFRKKLKELKHFYSTYNNFNHLWTQFNKELDNLQLNNFEEFYNYQPDKGQITINNSGIIGDVKNKGKYAAIGNIIINGK